MADDKPRWGIAPYFIVDNVVDTANYYRDKLGFEYERFWGEPPCFCMVRRSGIVIMLSQMEQIGVMRPNSVAVPDNGGCWDARGRQPGRLRRHLAPADPDPRWAPGQVQPAVRLLIRVTRLLANAG